MYDGHFIERFIRAWLTSRTVDAVARRMGKGMTSEEARTIAEALMTLGVGIPPDPSDLVLQDLLVLTQRDDDYVDRRGREAYRVGLGTPLEGPWWCSRCGEVRLTGFFVLPVGDLDARFICSRCVHVVNEKEPS